MRRCAPSRPSCCSCPGRPRRPGRAGGLPFGLLGGGGTLPQRPYQPLLLADGSTAGQEHGGGGEHRAEGEAVGVAVDPGVRGEHRAADGGEGTAHEQQHGAAPGDSGLPGRCLPGDGGEQPHGRDHAHDGCEPERGGDGMPPPHDEQADREQGEQYP
ncbi:hypothetical protein [Streptomyces sp. NPDC048442]|uniref:hypothetical protein n=1 Tax=Streptomyces sp. NPDC048442 TaxID=3154823 RepID=UPI003441D043